MPRWWWLAAEDEPLPRVRAVEERLVAEGIVDRQDVRPSRLFAVPPERRRRGQAADNEIPRDCQEARLWCR